MMEEARAALAPSGTLRAAINLANPLLVSQQDEAGVIDGVAPEMARAVASRLGVPLRLVPYPTAGAVAATAGAGSWDIGLIAEDPARTGISFTRPYVEIPATYMTPSRSGPDSVAEVDSSGVEIVAVRRTAYALWLAAHVTRATLVEVDDDVEALERFKRHGAVVAGLASTLRELAADLPDAIVLPGQFMAVQQAIGTSDGNPTGAAFLSEFVEDAKAAGLPAALITRFRLWSSLSPSRVE